jgi:hypothetical protein
MLRAELERDPGRLAVVGVEAVAGESADFSWRDYYKRALREMDEPLVDHKVSYQTPGAVRTMSRKALLSPTCGSSPPA